MKCPKCNFASFEYLNTCKKCGNDLSVHKTELGIDFPQYSSVGLMATLRREASPQAAMAETATMVEEPLDAAQLSETSTTEKLSGTAGFEAAIASDTDFTNIGGGVDLGHDDLDLSGLGESADETASISLPPVEEEEINLGAEPAAEPAKQQAAPEVKKSVGDIELGGIDFDLSSMEEPPAPAEKTEAPDLGEIEETVAPPAKEEEVAIELGDLDLGISESAEPAPPPAKEAVADIDLGDIEITQAKEKPAPPKAPAPGGDFDMMDGLDIDLNLDDLDLSAQDKPEAKAEPKKEEKKKDDFDIDIDLSDLKLD